MSGNQSLSSIVPIEADVEKFPTGSSTRSFSTITYLSSVLRSIMLKSGKQRLVLPSDTLPLKKENSSDKISDKTSDSSSPPGTPKSSDSVEHKRSFNEAFDFLDNVIQSFRYFDAMKSTPEDEAAYQQIRSVVLQVHPIIKDMADQPLPKPLKYSKYDPRYKGHLAKHILPYSSTTFNNYKRLREAIITLNPTGDESSNFLPIIQGEKSLILAEYWASFLGRYLSRVCLCDNQGNDIEKVLLFSMERCRFNYAVVTQKTLKKIYPAPLSQQEKEKKELRWELMGRILSEMNSLQEKEKELLNNEALLNEKLTQATKILQELLLEKTNEITNNIAELSREKLEAFKKRDLMQELLTEEPIIYLFILGHIGKGFFAQLETASQVCKSETERKLEAALTPGFDQFVDADDIDSDDEDEEEESDDDDSDSDFSSVDGSSSEEEDDDDKEDDEENDEEDEIDSSFSSDDEQDVVDHQQENSPNVSRRHSFLFPPLADYVPPEAYNHLLGNTNTSKMKY